MPQLGETVTEGTITRWFKHVGDQVAENELLFEVSTDKVDSEVPSPAAGLLSEILVQQGDTVDVGTVLARIGDAGSVPATEPAPARALEPAPPPQVSISPEAIPAPQPTSDARSSTMVADGTSMAAPAEQAAASARVAPVSDTDGRGDDASGDHRLLSPVVRRLIGEHGIDPATIEGTGAGGRITPADVQAVIERTGAAPAAPAPAPAPVVAVASGPRDTVVPFSNIRRRTAEHMVGSKSTSAHALAAMEVDYHNVERVRLAEKDAFRTDEGVALTYLPFVSRAVVDALRDFPELNASVGHDELIVHHDVHLGYAVDLEFQGLMVPVVHNADAKRLRALAREVADFAARARIEAARSRRHLGGHVHDHQRRVVRHDHDVPGDQPAADRHPLDRRRQEAPGRDRTIRRQRRHRRTPDWPAGAGVGPPCRRRRVRRGVPTTRQGDHRDPGLAAGAGVSAGPASTVHLRARPAHGVVEGRIASVGLISRGPSGYPRKSSTG